MSSGILFKLFDNSWLISPDRFIWIGQVHRCAVPFKYRQYGKPRVCIAANMIVYLYSIGFYSPFLFVFRVDPEKGVCRPYDFSVITRDQFFDVHPTMVLVFRGIIPIITVFTCTFLTIYKLRDVASKKKNNQSSVVPKQSRADNEITRQIIVVCLIFGVFPLFDNIPIRHKIFIFL